MNSVSENLGCLVVIVLILLFLSLPMILKSCNDKQAMDHGYIQKVDSEGRIYWTKDIIK